MSGEGEGVPGTGEVGERLGGGRPCYRQRGEAGPLSRGAPTLHDALSEAALWLLSTKGRTQSSAAVGAAGSVPGGRHQCADGTQGGPSHVACGRSREAKGMPGLGSKPLG